MRMRQITVHAAWAVAACWAAGLQADIRTEPSFCLEGIAYPCNVAIADFNNDGRADLAVATSGPAPKKDQPRDPSQSRVLILFQKDGRFALPADRELKPASPRGMAAGDFDGDGKTDLAVKDSGKKMHLFLGAEDMAADHVAVNVNDSDSSLTAARLSLGGVMDFLSGPVWRKWHGGDRFQNGYCYGPATNDNRQSVVADLDLDGNNDIVFCGGGRIRLCYGPLTDINVRPGEVAQFVELAPAKLTGALRVADLNGDGRPDIAAGLYDPASRSRSVAVWCQGAPLGFDPDAPPSAELADVGGALHAADLNGAGLADLVVSDVSKKHILVFLQREGVPLPRSADHAYQTLRVECAALAIGDVDGDRFPDLVVADGRSALRCFLNDGKDEPGRLAGKLVAERPPATASLGGQGDRHICQAEAARKMSQSPAAPLPPARPAAGPKKATLVAATKTEPIAAAAGILRDLPPPQPGPDYEDPYRMPFYTGTILPTPQQATYRDEFFPLDDAGLLLGPGLASDGPHVRELRERGDRYGGKLRLVDSPSAACSTLVLLGDVPAAEALLQSRRAPDREQGYLMLALSDGQRKTVVLKGRDSLGLLWAIASFSQLVHARSGRPVVRAADVLDWPETPNRGFIAGHWPDGAPGYCMAFKINKPVFQSALVDRSITDRKKQGEAWRSPPTEAIRRDLRAYGERLSPLGICWYAGVNPTHGPNKIRSGNEEDFQAILAAACAAEEAGGHLCLKYDDSRFPISADDMRKFGSAREADVYFLLRLDGELRRRHPQARILFCPPFYWGPDSAALYPEPRDDYLFALGKRLPPQIEIFWTGPRVKSGQVTPDMVAWITERIGRKPVYWQNGFGAPHMFLYHYVTDPIRVYQEWFYEGFFHQMDSYMFNCGMPGYAAAAATCADYCWNPKAYDADRSIREAVVKLVGPDTYPALVALNRALSYFDPFGLRRTPGAAQRLPEMGQKLADVKAVWEEVQRRNKPAVLKWTSMQRHVDQVTKFYEQLRRSPNLAAYRQDAAESEKQARQEAGFSEKTGVFLSAYDFTGGCGPKHYAIRCERRLATWIYGARSANPAMETGFAVDPFPPSSDYEVVISGQDDDAEARCKIRIWVNQTKIFEGENPFAQQGWSRHTFRIPAACLERQSRLRIENAEATGRASGPPFFMLNYAVVRKAR